MARYLAITFVGFLWLVQFHSAEFSSHFSNMMGDRIDIRFCAFIIEHLFQSFSGRAEWLSPGLFYPVKETLGYSETFLLHVFAYAPFRLLSFDSLSALQFAIIVLNFLTYVCTWLFLRRGLGVSLLSATIAALVFSFNSAKFNQLNHIQLQPLLLLPLISWLLWSYLKRLGENSSSEIFRKLSLAALLFNLQLLTSVYVAWYFAFWVLLFFAFWLFLEQGKRSLMIKEFQSNKTAFAAAAMVFFVGLVPFIRIYIPVVMETGTRSYSELKPMIPRWQSLFWMDSTNYLWGWLANKFSSFYHLPLHWEHRIGLGAIITLGFPTMFFMLIFKFRKSDEIGKYRLTLPLILTCSVICFYTLGMTYFNGQSPWWLVFTFIPGASSIRAVSRYALVTALPISILLALIMDFTISNIKTMTAAKKKMSGAALSIFIAFTLFEQMGKQHTFSKDDELEKAATLAQRIESDCDSFYLTTNKKTPEFIAELHGDALMVSMLTGKPTLNGYSGQSPKGWPLWEIGSVDYLPNVEKWRKTRSIPGKICSLSLD